MTSLRRSKRIQQNSSSASVDSDAEIRPITCAKPEKTKHTGTENENAQKGQIVRLQRPDKYVRGRRGHLKFMTEMPLDVLYEIFRQLDPIDLLHLSWASKSLHGIVIEKSSIFMWEEAFERLYKSNNPPPRCPRDVNLIQYTRFLYHPKCMICHTRTGSNTSWVMRMRVCNSCLDSDLFSRCDHPSFLTIRGKKFCYALTSDLEEWKKTGNWREMLVLVCEREKEARSFDCWKRKCAGNRINDLYQRRAQRKIAILKKLEEIGWTELKIKGINYGQLPDDLPGFNTVKKLTNREWEEIRPKIESVLADKKEKYLAILKKQRLCNRWHLFTKAFKKWEEAQTLGMPFRPRASDIVVAKPFFTAVFNTDTEEAKFEIADINHAAKEWIEWRDNLVLSVLPQDLQDRYRANELWRQPLAILWFSRPITGMIDNVCGHRRKIHEDVPQSLDDRRIYDALLKVDPYSGPWKWFSQNLKFDTKRFEVIRDILEFVEMDPYTTTMDQVRKCTLTFSCLPCKARKRLTCEEMIEHDLVSHYHEGEERPPLSTRWVRAK